MFFSGWKIRDKEEEYYGTVDKAESTDQENIRKIAFYYTVTTPSDIKKNIFKNEMVKYHEKIDSSESIDCALDAIEKLIPNSLQELIPDSIFNDISASIQSLKSEQMILNSELMIKNISNINIAEYFLIAAYLILEAKIYAYEKFPPGIATDSVTEQFSSFPETVDAIFSSDNVSEKFFEYGLLAAENSKEIKDRSLLLIENVLGQTCSDNFFFSQ